MLLDLSVLHEVPKGLKVSTSDNNVCSEMYWSIRSNSESKCTVFTCVYRFKRNNINPDEKSAEKSFHT